MSGTADDAQHLKALLTAVSGGDRVAFKTLYDLSAAKLYGAVSRILSDRDAARDIVQEAYVKIWQNAARFDAAKAAPTTWMLAIARNQAIDALRRHRPEARAVDADDMAETLGSFDDPLASRDRSEELTRLMGCLDGLDGPKREAVLLAYYHGQSRDELSRRFGIPVPTVKTWLHRSLAQLRGCLGS